MLRCEARWKVARYVEMLVPERAFPKLRLLLASAARGVVGFRRFAAVLLHEAVLENLGLREDTRCAGECMRARKVERIW